MNDHSALYVKAAVEFYEPHRNVKDAEAMTAYMRGQFQYFGIRATQQRMLEKEFVARYGLPDDWPSVLEGLWNCKERELQYIGLRLVDTKRKKFEEQDLELIEFIINNKPWWDTVDHTAKWHAGLYLQQHEAKRPQVLEKWLASANMWEVRTAILFQLGYKDKTDEQLLFEIIRRTASSKEFFIAKAIGWALREYSKNNPAAVQEFVRTVSLQPLSHREALKWLLSRKDGTKE
jgi:3-methyladenine DNA glycosylase AlkD